MNDEIDWSAFENSATKGNIDWTAFENQPIDETVKNPTKDNKYLKLDDSMYKQTPSTIDRIKDEAYSALVSGGQSFAKIGEPIAKGASKVVGIVYPTVETWLDGTLAENMKWYGEEVAKNKEARISKYGSETWGTGQAVGSIAPDIVGSTAKGATALGLSMMELGLSTARNDLFKSTEVPIVEKLKTISTDVATAFIGAKLVNKFLPTNQAEDLEAMAAKIPDSVTRNKVLGATESMRKAGIDKLDFEARDAILKDIVAGKIVDDLDLSNIISEKVNTAFKNSYNKVNKLYDDAGTIGRQIDSKNSKEIFSDFAKWMDTEYRNGVLNREAMRDEKSINILTEFEKRLNTVDIRNVDDLELLRKKYAGLSGIKSGEEAFAYGRISNFLESKVDDRFKELKLENPYLAPRKEYVQHLDTFTSKTSKEFGSKIEQSIEDPSVFYKAEQILGEKIKPDSAFKFVNTISKDAKVRSSVVANAILKGLPKEVSELGFDEANVIISNFDKLDRNGLKIMLGEQGEKQLRNQIEALAMITRTEKTVSQKDLSTVKEVLNLGTAAIAAQYFPLASAHSAVSSVKNLYEKTFGSSDQKKTVVKELIKKISGIENAEAKKQLTRAVFTSSGLTANQIYTERKYSDNDLIKFKQPLQ